MDIGGGLEVPEPSGGGGGSGIAMDFPAAGSSPPARVPGRIRRRLLESRGGSPSSVEEIEAKLKEADIRRQQFLDWLSSKARPKSRSPSWSSQEEDLGHKLEAKLFAAEQKRLNILAKSQLRLARMDGLRQAAKTGVEKRFEKERQQLSAKVESRIQQAEENRKSLLKARVQRRTAVQERKARSLMQRASRENKYKDCVRSAMSQKRAAAEKKRMVLLEAEKKKAHARVVQAHHIAMAVSNQRESERSRLKEQLENRLLKARRQRAEYLMHRGNLHSSPINLKKQGDFLSRKLARCWRSFVRSRKTTFALAKAYKALEINENTVKSMPFEQLALHIESSLTLQTVKVLLDRLEKRFMLCQASTSSGPENIDHLLKHLASPNKKGSSSKVSRNKTVPMKDSPRESKYSVVVKPSRYPVRLVLCAYMVLGHPNAVFNGRGEREVALAESAIKLVQEFELLIKIILEGPISLFSTRQSTPYIMTDDLNQHECTSQSSYSLRTFKNQLHSFDKAWCSYLYHFVVWKVKDARSLEDDLVRAACQLEVSMMQTCKLTHDGKASDLSHDLRAIQNQVAQDQQLLRDKIRHLSGESGIERMESALSDTRSKYFKAKGSGSPVVPHVISISSPTDSTSSKTLNSPKERNIVRSLFGSDSELSKAAPQPNSIVGCPLPSDNEFLVNEILHEGCFKANNSSITQMDEISIQVKVQETMERAFWDGVMDSLKDDKPEYDRLVGLVKEVRDELCEMAPKNWEKEICESMDLVIVSQVFESGMQDADYLGGVLEYALNVLQKLSAPADEDNMKKSHDQLLSELAVITQSNDRSKGSFAIAVVKGLRFILNQIKVLKKEISKAQILMMEPIIKGRAGVEYLQKAFSDLHGLPSASSSDTLPRTAKWVALVKSSAEDEWNEYNASLATSLDSHGVPNVPVLRAGGSVPRASEDKLLESRLAMLSTTGYDQPGCNGEKLDIILRLGLLKLATAIEGLTAETLPETMRLNLLRLRAVQSQFQQLIVIATSNLVLRQILVAERSATSPGGLEDAISNCIEKLFEVLGRSPDAGVEEISDAIVGSAPDVLQPRKGVVARMLVRSLQGNDPVFSKVSQAVYMAAQGVVLGGTGARGRELVEKALRRIGAVFLSDRLVKAAEVLVVAATVSASVHGPWYGCLV